MSVFQLLAPMILPSNRFPEPYDVAIVGGGPAGSVAASALARSGRRVVLFEKEKFPRFHIGESLLPNGNAILKEVGVWEKIVAAGFVEKYGAEFTVPDRSSSVRNVFADGIVPGMEQAYQVERSRFDEILLRHAEELGCEVREECGVSAVSRLEEGGWEIVAGADSTPVQSRWMIDASGRSSFMGRKLGLKKESIPYPGRFAVFNHFEGFPRAEGKRGGDIIVIRLENAWFWVIPISPSVTSVGVVAQKGARSGGGEPLDAFFWKQARRSPWLESALGDCEAKGDYRLESDYCFSWEAFGKDRVLMAGDAASFIDPVFSSGVYLALESGHLAAKLIDAELERSRGQDSQRIYKSYTRSMKKRIGIIRRLIESYYDNKSFDVFMTPKPLLRLPNAINSILAGCALPPFAVRWRFWLFRKICRWNAKLSFIDPVRWSDFDKKNDLVSK